MCKKGEQFHFKCKWVDTQTHTGHICHGNSLMCCVHVAALMGLSQCECELKPANCRAEGFFFFFAYWHVATEQQAAGKSEIMLSPLPRLQEDAVWQLPRVFFNHILYHIQEDVQKENCRKIISQMFHCTLRLTFLIENLSRWWLYSLIMNQLLFDFSGWSNDSLFKLFCRPESKHNPHFWDAWTTNYLVFFAC